MEISSAAIGAWVGSAVWPFMRISALLMANPVFGSRSVPVRVRVVLAVLLSVVVVPLVPSPPAVDLFGAEGLLISLQEILIGLSLGFSLQLIFSAFVMAGDYISNAMGLGFASMADPLNGVSVPIISQLVLLLTFLLFFATGAHLLLIEFLVRSFVLLPIGALHWSAAHALAIAAWASQMFLLAAAVSLPVLASLLLVYLALGVMTRAAPQLNIFSVGFPLTILAGLVLLAICLQLIGARFDTALEQGLGLFSQLIGG